MENPRLCVDTGGRETGELILYPCHGFGTQFFALNYKKTIRVENDQFCWMSHDKAGASPELAHCSQKPPNNYMWRYDPVSSAFRVLLFILTCCLFCAGN